MEAVDNLQEMHLCRISHPGHPPLPARRHVASRSAACQGLDLLRACHSCMVLSKLLPSSDWRLLHPNLIFKLSPCCLPMQSLTLQKTLAWTVLQGARSLACSTQGGRGMSQEPSPTLPPPAWKLMTAWTFSPCFRAFLNSST